MVIYALVQAEAGITELIYLIRIFTVVTNLVFNHPSRVYETVVFELYQFVENDEKPIPGKREILIIANRPGITCNIVESLGYAMRTGLWKERRIYLSTSMPFLLLATISNKKDFSSLKINQG